AEAFRPGAIGMRASAPALGWATACMLLLVYAVHDPRPEFLGRGMRYIHCYDDATRNIYLQHYQMARLIEERLPGRVIALNDIGVVNFFTDAQTVDLVGLGTLDVARARLAGHADFASLDAICRRRGVAVALIYRSWFPDVFWPEIARWRLELNAACGDITLNIYALEPEARPELTHILASFVPTLPPGSRTLQ